MIISKRRLFLFWLIMRAQLHFMRPSKSHLWAVRHNFGCLIAWPEIVISHQNFFWVIKQRFSCISRLTIVWQLPTCLGRREHRFEFIAFIYMLHVGWLLLIMSYILILRQHLSHIMIRLDLHFFHLINFAITNII